MASVEGDDAESVAFPQVTAPTGARTGRPGEYRGIPVPELLHEDNIIALNNIIIK